MNAFTFTFSMYAKKEKKKKSGINAGRMEEGASDIYSKLGGWCTEHGQAPS